MTPTFFLDIDGVINKHHHTEAVNFLTFHPECVVELNFILAEVPHHAVVLTTAWRTYVTKGQMKLEDFYKGFIERGVSPSMNLIGVTPDLGEGKYRGREIQHWLLDNDHKGTFAVVDDAPPWMCFKPVARNLVTTEPRKGLTRETACSVVCLLKGLT